MAGVTNDDLKDLLQTTLEDLPSGQFEVALLFQSYPICDQWFKGDRKKSTSGTAISRRIQLNSNGSAQHVRLYEPTVNNQVDVMATVTAPWVYAEAKHHYEAHEVSMNRNPARLIDLVKERRIAAYVDLADEIEVRAWETPPTQADDLMPQGVPYWISFVAKNSTDYTGGFNGTEILYGDGTTSSVKGGINGTLAQNGRWANWCANHTGMNMDTIDTLRRGMRRTKFTPPSSIHDMYKGAGSRYRIYTNLTFADEYERLVNAGPDDRNGDLNPFGGLLTFKRIPWMAIPVLDDSAYDPIYCLCHRHFFPYVHRDWWMKEDSPIRDRDQRHVFTVGIDCQYQFFCTNVREGGFVISLPVT